MYKINMMSKADMVKGHGVLSAYEEQVALIKSRMKDEVVVEKNNRNGADITHYHSINPEFYLSVPKMKRKGKTVGYVHFLPETVENSIKLPRLAKNIFYKYMLSFYKKMDYLVTVNPCFIEKLMAYGIPQEKITYIPNFVSEEMFYPEDKSRKEEIQKSYGIEEGRFTVLCVGQMQKRKGIFDFVEIAKQMPEMQFVWAGGFSFGKITDGYEEIKKMLEHKPDNVTFLGIVDREKMNDIYNMADVMFLPSYEELFPMTILESMNCRVPILVRDLELYEPILFNHAIKGNSNEEFIHILKKLDVDEWYYEDAAANAYKGHLRYNEETVANMWKEFYTAVYNEGQVVLN